MQEEDVGPKHEMKLVWTDMQEEDVGPKHEMKLVWADVKKESVGLTLKMIICDWRYVK